MTELSIAQEQENGINLLNNRFPGKLSRNGDNWVFDGSLILRAADNAPVRETWRLPDNLKVNGKIELSGQEKCTALGKNLEATHLSVGGSTWASKIEDGSQIGTLGFIDTSISEIGDNVSINSTTSLDTDFKKIGMNFTVNGNLLAEGASDVFLSSGLSVKGDVHLSYSTVTFLGEGMKGEKIEPLLNSHNVYVSPKHEDETKKRSHITCACRCKNWWFCDY